MLLQNYVQTGNTVYDNNTDEECNTNELILNNNDLNINNSDYQQQVHLSSSANVYKYFTSQNIFFKQVFACYITTLTLLMLLTNKSLTAY